FFQAEDGIRDYKVTGVQTCALPISVTDLHSLNIFKEVEFVPVDADVLQKLYAQTKNAISREFTFSERTVIPEIPGVAEAYLGLRSEERRVGKECRSWGWAKQSKEKA